MNENIVRRLALSYEWLASRMNRRSLLLVVTLVAVAMIVELALVLLLNEGSFTYTLDDPYIHLALSERIARLHYGLNGEPASPSSSIAWPFLLAVAAPHAFHTYVPLCLNMVCAVLYGLLTFRILRASSTEQASPNWTIGLTAAILLWTNQIGLAFTGMEHSLQNLLALVSIYGVLHLTRSGRISRVWIASLVLGPLIRYEHFSVVVASAFVLFLCRRRTHGAFVLACSAVPVLLFGYFLHSLGLPWIPSSILVKSSTLGEPLSALSRFEPVAVLCLASLGMLLTSRFAEQRQLLWFVLVVCAAHLSLGRFGWFGRYEAYALTIAIVGLSATLLSRPSSRLFFQGKFSALAFVAGSLMCFRTVLPTLKTPLAAREIFRQQYQLRRLVADHWRDSVAVNDLGLISYRNTNSVLDLWGLGSEKARRARLSASPGWMDDLVREGRVDLVLVHAKWFDGQIPPTWTQVAELSSGAPPLVVGDSRVSIFVTNSSEALLARVKSSLEKFEQDLPLGSTLIWALPFSEISKTPR